MQTTDELIDSSPATATVPPRPWAILASSAYRKLWAAGTLSWFGNFFSYVAMAWLVLQLTGSSFALGTVLVIQALPRAILMVLGGALSDRISARLTMLASMGLRAAAVAPLALLVLEGHAQMWEVYVVAAIFGVVDAFFLPARQSILPSIVADHELEPANSLLNVTTSATLVVGPVAAGLVVTAFGTGWAFAADAACFAVGFLLIAWLPAAARASGAAAHRAAGLGGQILEGLRYAWADVGIRTLLVVVAVIDFGANGAIGVGLPTLAHGRFAAGAAGYGVMLGAWGIGATLGALGAGVVPPPRRFGWLIVALCLWLGLGMLAVGLVPSLPLAAVTMGLSGLGTGVVNTYGISWLQRRTASNMQGRVMSLVMLASTGLTPIAYAASGALAQLNPTLLFVIAAGMMFLCAAGSSVSRQVRSLR
ncbi:MAG TPA: MFS transporter [Candidatus Dormibacteraeota bacterium]|jgi:MFS family permease|nr:MFS transporter [Candidatus Dormibacteraeota bacterium]